MVHNKDGSGYLSHNKEGLTQGHPLAMITYGIRILPLICELRTVNTHIMQPCYREDSGAGGTFEALHDHMNDLLVRRPL